MRAVFALPHPRDEILKESSPVLSCSRPRRNHRLEKGPFRPVLPCQNRSDRCGEACQNRSIVVGRTRATVLVGPLVGRLPHELMEQVAVGGMDRNAVQYQ